MRTLLDYFLADENAKVLARIRAFVKEKYPKWEIVEVKLCQRCKRRAVVLIKRGKIRTVVSYECDEPLKAAIPLVSCKGRIGEKEVFVQITDDGIDEFLLIHFHNGIAPTAFMRRKTSRDLLAKFRIIMKLCFTIHLELKYGTK